MIEKNTGVVLHCLKYNDTSNIIEVYTKLSGRASYLIKVTQSRKAAFKSTLFRPLAVLELETENRSSSTLQRVIEARPTILQYSIPSSPIKSAIALFLGEFLYHALREEAANDPLFAYLTHSIQWLEQAPSTNIANFHLVFLIRLSRFLGLYPNTDSYLPGDWFDLQSACFARRQPFHGSALPPEEAVLIRTLIRMNYDTMHLFAFNRKQRIRCIEVLNDYYRLHIPNFPQLRSLEVLQELFD